MVFRSFLHGKLIKVLKSFYISNSSWMSQIFQFAPDFIRSQSLNYISSQHLISPLGVGLRCPQAFSECWTLLFGFWFPIFTVLLCIIILWVSFSDNSRFQAFCWPTTHLLQLLIYLTFVGLSTVIVLFLNTCSKLNWHISSLTRCF